MSYLLFFQVICEPEEWVIFIFHQGAKHFSLVDECYLICLTLSFRVIALLLLLTLIIPRLLLLSRQLVHLDWTFTFLTFLILLRTRSLLARLVLMRLIWRFALIGACLTSPLVLRWRAVLYDIGPVCRRFLRCYS